MLGGEIRAQLDQIVYACGNGVLEPDDLRIRLRWIDPALGNDQIFRVQHDRPVPILMLTARDSEADLLVGLAVGADDYMTKPFSMRELIARVHALLRRVHRNAADPDLAPVRIGPIELDAETRRVRNGDEPVHLTPTEFDLLHYLAARPGRVATREELLAQVWGYDVPSGARTVDSHIRSIRRKLGADLIRTVHGVGYAVEEAPVWN